MFSKQKKEKKKKEKKKGANKIIRAVGTKVVILSKNFI